VNNQFFPETLPKNTSRVFHYLSDKTPVFLESFYLSGGTALSLQLGHRESEDLDFFSSKQFSPQRLEQQLKEYGSLAETELARGTLNTFLNGVKLQFLEYPYPLIKPLIQWRGINLSSVLDIGCTKLQTVGMRGSRKDFIDIYFLLEKYSLQELLETTREKYVESDYSETHILKSLIYFIEAENQPMSRMHKDVSWEEVKTAITAAVKTIDIG
jgi:hypothetical protein